MLYEKVMVGKKTTYRPYMVPQNTLNQMDGYHLITIMSTLTLSTLMEMEKLFPPLSKITTELKRTEDAISRMARLVPRGLDDEMVKLGTMAWNSAATTIQQGLKGASA